MRFVTNLTAYIPPTAGQYCGVFVRVDSAVLRDQHWHGAGGMVRWPIRQHIEWCDRIFGLKASWGQSSC